MYAQMDHGRMRILINNGEIIMADARPEPFMFGTISGTYYNFDNEGDVVDTHYHGSNLGHICVVLSGEVKCESMYRKDGNWDKILSTGDVLNMPDEEWHKITALKPNTKIMNINKFVLWSPNNTVIGH